MPRFGKKSCITVTASGHFGGGAAWPVTRNLVRYPVFSAFWPSRRLNMEGDPAAKAPIPGEKIWPASFLDHLIGD